MKGRPQGYMKVGLVNFMAWPEVSAGEGPVVRTIRKIADDPYFDAVDVTHVASDSVRREAQEVARDGGLTVAFGAQPVLLRNGLSLCDTSPSGRKAAVAAVMESIDEAAGWNATGVGVLSGPDPGHDRRDEATEALVESLSMLCETAAAYDGMPIVLESFDRLSFGKRALVGPNMEAAEIAQKVRAEHPNFGLLIDLGHLPLQGEAPRKALATTAEYLLHVHVGNCVMRSPDHAAYGDEHPVIGAAEGENGEAELAEFLTELFRFDYLGEGKRPTVSYEVKPFGDQTPEEVIQISKDYLDRAWVRVSRDL